MIDHVWTVICAHAVVDLHSNNASLLHVIEQLTLAGEPEPGGVLRIALEAMTLWARADLGQPAHGLSRITFRSPSGNVLAETDLREVDLTEYKRLRQRMRFQGLPLDGPGRYAFVVEFRYEGETDWQEVAEVPVEVIFEPPDVAEADSGEG